ncbi:hypothetical protein J3458_004733 [Metarhizium acridum]|uniref:uncharacterized protein n=1 Tax=Metarhizium acridum TaxID=92637 RepID=UPI001C6A9E91|nr:hypothetical protein J3458_004733 [Metarhizium acridum]
MDRNDAKGVYKYYRHVLIPRFGHLPPNIDGKPVLNVDNLLVSLSFNSLTMRAFSPANDIVYSLPAATNFFAIPGHGQLSLWMANGRSRKMDRSSSFSVER